MWTWMIMTALIHQWRHPDQPPLGATPVQPLFLLVGFGVDAFCAWSLTLFFQEYAVPLWQAGIRDNGLPLRVRMHSSTFTLAFWSLALESLFLFPKVVGPLTKRLPGQPRRIWISAGVIVLIGILLMPLVLFPIVTLPSLVHFFESKGFTICLVSQRNLGKSTQVTVELARPAGLCAEGIDLGGAK